MRTEHGPNSGIEELNQLFRDRYLLPSKTHLMSAFAVMKY